jgi:hypothetical protein
MKTREAQEQAARLGLGAWIAQAVAVGKDGSELLVERKCVGFQSADFALAEGETWGEVFAEVEHIIFGA